MTAIKTIPCLKCGGAFERKRSTARFCAACRIERKREKDAESQRALYARRQAFIEAAESLREHIMPEHYRKAEDYINELGASDVRDIPLVLDRMPDGTHSDKGPDDGTSTNYVDLAIELDQRQARALADEWFEANPHWREGLYV